MKPKIGITTGCQNQLGTEDFLHFENYIKAIELSGGEPVLLTSNELSNTKKLSDLDGLLLTGGGDIPSYFWGEVSDSLIKSKDENRALFERPLIHYARTKGKPILGVCLGLQVINVSLGGTLHKDLPTPLHKKRQHEKPSDKELKHMIKVIPGTRISKILPFSLKVNSRHHQAIKDLAPGIKISARAEDNVIEAIESEGPEWMVGIQWHPEDLINDEPQLNIFKTFISACKASMEKRK